jgi:hypothetical protein
MPILPPKPPKSPKSPLPMQPMQPMQKRCGLIVVRQAGSAAGLVPVADALAADVTALAANTPSSNASQTLAALAASLAAHSSPTAPPSTTPSAAPSATPSTTDGWHIDIIAYPLTVATCREVAANPSIHTIHAVDSEEAAQRAFNQCIGNAAFVLTGTSERAEADAQFWRAARQHGVPTIAYLDQWSGITERFPGNTRNDWPDHLAVIDAHDQKLAQAIAPAGVAIHITGSPAVDNIVRQVQQLRAQGITADPLRIVFATEPSAQPAQYRAIHGGTDEDSFALALALIRTRHPGAHLVMRLHPRDTQARWLAHLPHDIAHTWDDKTRAETLACSGIVFGMRSFFLVEAAAAGVKVFSLQPGKKTYCPLTDERMKVVTGEGDYL